VPDLFPTIVVVKFSPSFRILDFMFKSLTTKSCCEESLLNITNSYEALAANLMSGFVLLNLLSFATSNIPSTVWRTNSPSSSMSESSNKPETRDMPTNPPTTAKIVTSIIVIFFKSVSPL
jgi:hypothetical protein